MAQSIKFNNNVYLDANSVVVDNTGTKLPDVLGVSVNYPSTEVSPQTVPTNADMLGGLPASDYVKYTDEHIGDIGVDYPSVEPSPQTVPTNADMLGGLPASDYVKHSDEHIGDIGVEYSSVALSPQTVPTNAEMLGGLAASKYVLHSDALSLEEIEASTSLDGKVASASAVKALLSRI